MKTHKILFSVAFALFCLTISARVVGQEYNPTGNWVASSGELFVVEKLPAGIQIGLQQGQTFFLYSLGENKYANSEVGMTCLITGSSSMMIGHSSGQIFQCHKTTSGYQNNSSGYSSNTGASSYSSGNNNGRKDMSMIEKLRRKQQQQLAQKESQGNQSQNTGNSAGNHKRSSSGGGILSDVDIGIPVVENQSPYRFALIFGNEDYSSHQSGLNAEVNVDFAAKDAKTFRQYAIKTLGVPAENIILELNSDAVSMNSSIKKLQMLIKNSGGKAEVFFYYAGHGFPHEETKEAYLIPVNVSGSDLEFAVKLKDIYKKLTEYPAKRITVFLDACFSGGARNQGLLATRGIAVKPRDNMLNGNLVVLTASSGTQSALPYREKAHGLFTYFLLKKLKESKGELSYSELYEYVKRNVSNKAVLLNNKEQTPALNVSPSVKDQWESWKFL